MLKRETPHQAIITFDIDIRALNIDGDVDASRLSDERLSKDGKMKTSHNWGYPNYQTEKKYF